MYLKNVFEKCIWNVFGTYDQIHQIHIANTNANTLKFSRPNTNTNTLKLSRPNTNTQNSVFAI